jgi:hypothetical protein
MGKREITKAIVGTLLLGAPVAGFAQAGWVPGSEITGQSVQVETNGVTDTVFFDPSGVARTQTPSGKSVPGTWAAANGQLCLTTGAAQECWPYSQPFQAGQQISLTVDSARNKPGCTSSAGRRRTRLSDGVSS